MIPLPRFTLDALDGPSRSPFVPVEERSTGVRAHPNSAANTPASRHPAAYADWKEAASDDARDAKHATDLAKIRERGHRLPGEYAGPFAGPCPTPGCKGRRVYCGHYCTEAHCPRSLEGSDLVYAIKRGDLVEALRLSSIMFGDDFTIAHLAEFISGVWQSRSRL